MATPSEKGKIIAQKATNILSLQPGVEKILLIGKVASDEATETSDVDLLVVCGCRVDLKATLSLLDRKLILNGFEVVGNTKPPMGIDLTLKYSWDVDTGNGNRFVREIKRKGICLFPEEK